MKKNWFVFTLLLWSSISTFSQSTARFTVQVSTDSVLMDNPFQVVFSLENAAGNNFQAPDLSLYFDVISGPNVSTSMQLLNGQMSQSVSFTYYLRPRETGLFFIEATSVETPEGYLETLPIEIIVVPNPDGIQQAIPGQAPGNFNLNIPGYEQKSTFPSMEDMMQQMEQLFGGNNGLFDGPNNFFAVPPDSLWKQLPDAWKKLLPEGVQPADQKKRKIYRM